MQGIDWQVGTASSTPSPADLPSGIFFRIQIPHGQPYSKGMQSINIRQALWQIAT